MGNEEYKNITSNMVTYNIFVFAIMTVLAPNLDSQFSACVCKETLIKINVNRLKSAGTKMIIPSPQEQMTL